MERKIVQIERGNVILRVPKENVQRYIDQGYSLLDDNGNVIQEGIPRDIATLRKAYVDHTKKIEKLQEEIKSLKESLKEKKKPGRKKADAE